MLTTAQIKQQQIQNALDTNSESDSFNTDYTSDIDDSYANYSDYDQSIQEPVQFKLRPHQLEALDFMNSNDIGVMQLFCGTGKSRIMYEFMIQQINKYQKYNTLIVIPNLPLIDQFDQFYIQNEQNTLDRESLVIRLNVNIIDSKHQNSFKSEHISKDANLVIISYASLDKVKDHIQHFNLVMFDEAHHIVTKKKIAFIQQIPNVKVFYFTATPKIDNKLLNMYENDTNNPINCGQVFKYDFRTAVQDQWVVDYQLNFCIYNQIQDQTDSSNIKDQFNALVQFAQLHKRTRIIAFNQYINKTSDVKTNSKAFTDLGNDKVQVQTICGTTNPDDRKSIFDWFQQEDYETTKIIFNAACIKEGIDLPCTDLIVFCDDKQSPIQIVQCIGRGTRLSNNKQYAIITAMIRQSDQCEFKIITNICKALKDSDTQMRDIMDQQRLAEFIKFTNCTKDINPANSVVYKDFTDKIVVELTQQDRYHYDRLEEILEYCKTNNKLPNHHNKYKEIQSIGSWLHSRKQEYKNGILDKDLKIAIESKLQDFCFVWQVNKIQEQYDRLDQILEYCQNNNKLPNGQDKDKKIASMGKWLSRNKREQKKDKLDKDLKIAIESKLKDFGFVWQFDQLEEHFKRIQEIHEYCQKKNKLPSQADKDAEIKSMGQWLSDRKIDYNNCRLDPKLKIAIESKLKDFGFYWDKLYEYYDRLKQIVDFCQKTNKLPNSHDKDAEIKSMGCWLNSRKGNYKQGKLDEKLKLAIQDQLTPFNFVWEGKYQITNTHKQQINPKENIYQIVANNDTNALQMIFAEDSNKLINYHKAREIKCSKVDPQELSYNIIIKELSQQKFKNPRNVIDLGCGMNKIAEQFKQNQLFNFTSIDFQILPQAFGQVIQGNISNLVQIEDNTYYYAIMSLCFWGTDFKHSIEECYRILEDNGLLYIVQSNKLMNGFIDILIGCGFSILREQKLNKFTLIKCIKQ